MGTFPAGISGIEESNAMSDRPRFPAAGDILAKANKPTVVHLHPGASLSVRMAGREPIEIHAPENVSEEEHIRIIIGTIWPRPMPPAPE